MLVRHNKIFSFLLAVFSCVVLFADEPLLRFGVVYGNHDPGRWPRINTHGGRSHALTE